MFEPHLVTRTETVKIQVRIARAIADGVAWFTGENLSLQLVGDDA